MSIALVMAGHFTKINIIPDGFGVTVAVAGLVIYGHSPNCKGFV